LFLLLVVLEPVSLVVLLNNKRYASTKAAPKQHLQYNMTSGRHPSRVAVLLGLLLAGAVLSPVFLLYCSNQQRTMLVTPNVVRGTRKDEQTSILDEEADDISISSSPSRATSSRFETIPQSHLSDRDLYAGAWWQSTARFAKVNATVIHNLEGASFEVALRTAGGKHDAKMAFDWLDFSIEHLSKWWKTIGDHGTAFAIGKLQAYTQRVMTSPKLSNMMSNTIAVIPHGSFEKNPRTEQMRCMALVATIGITTEAWYRSSSRCGPLPLGS
jgi:hypothetical protein